MQTGPLFPPRRPVLYTQGLSDGQPFTQAVPSQPPLPLLDVCHSLIMQLKMSLKPLLWTEVSWRTLSQHLVWEGRFAFHQSTVGLSTSASPERHGLHIGQTGWGTEGKPQEQSDSRWPHAFFSPLAWKPGNEGQTCLCWSADLQKGTSGRRSWRKAPGQNVYAGITHGQIKLVVLKREPSRLWGWWGCCCEFRVHICIGKPPRGAESPGPLPVFVPEAQAAAFTCLSFSRVLLVR